MPTTDIPPGEYLKSSSSSSSTDSSSSSLEHVASNLSISSLSNYGDEINIDNQPQVQYEPIVLPKETTLDELLRNVSSSNDLDTLAEVHLKVSSNMLGLQRLNVFLPKLVSLNLDGSYLGSLRDLGSNLSVKYLNISRCGLTNLDGTNGLISVQHLVADGNAITNLQPLCNLENLRILSIRGNRVNNLGAISFLVLCQELHELELANNPVAQMNGYRDYVKKNIPDLCLLDGMSFDDGSQPTSGLSETISSSDYSASVETTSCSEKKSLTHEDQLVSSNDIVCVDQNVIRPSSCGGLEPKNFVVRKSIDRPSTADAAANDRTLTMGEPIFGNIVRKVRRQRKKFAWTTDAEAQSSSSDSSRASSARRFPNTLPQRLVELELGVVGVASSSFNENIGGAILDIDINGNEEVTKLLVAARKWRMNVRKDQF